MHRGCFVCTPTPPLSGRRTPRPDPARVCVCMLCLARWGGAASWARCGAPDLAFGRSWCALCLFSPLRAGVAPFVVVVGVLFFFLPPPHHALFVSCFACFPASGVLGLGVLLPPPNFCLPPPRCPWRFLFSGLRCLGPLRLVPPPFFFLFFCFFSFFSCFSFFRLFSLLPLPAVRCGAGLCVLGRRVCPCVPPWCCPGRRSVCAGWCCVVLAVGPGCPLLSPGGSWCRVSVVLSLSGRVARRPVVWRGVSWCSAALCCVLLRRAVVWWCAVVLCRLSVSLPVSVVCFLPLRVCCVCSLCVPGCPAVCSLSSPPCVVPSCTVMVPFRRAVGVVCAVSGGWCCWFLVSMPFVGGLLVALVARCCRFMVCVGSGARVWSGRRSASSLWCPAPHVLCPMVLCCRVVLCCGALSSFFPFLLAGGACFLLFPIVSRLRAGSGLFLFLCTACAVLCWCACIVALRVVRSCPCGADWCFLLLPVVFVCLLLRLAVLCCLLVGPGGSWCRVLVACCCVSLGAVPRRVAARCAAWRCVVVRRVFSFCSVWGCRTLCCVLRRCPLSWGPVPSGAVFCLVPPRCVCFPVVCRCVVLFAAVLCAVCALGCGVLCFLSSLPCAVLLCGLLSLGALLPCAVPRGAVLPRGAVVSCPAALLGLFLA